ncbi:MAG: metallophosphoesterase [Clostridia bacterium]|nr:metallophosphoesterase [Clostridia bacterium]
MSEYFRLNPAVFSVDKYYQIMMPCEKSCLFFVKVGGKCFYDESNGIMRSSNEIHRVEVPAKLLDEAKEYTVCIRPIVERKAYFTETEEIIEKTYKFFPVPESNARAYHISDAHNLVAEPIKAAETFGDADFLILNGDVIEDSSDPSKFMNIYEICSYLMKGEKPSVFSRGNHDLRGNYAEKFADYTPTHLCNTYYSFRLGSIWGILLDCGEDKPDDHAEYGFTVACHSFRERQTEFLKSIIANKENEYDAENVRHKLVISHNAFCHRYQSPFDIEQDIFSEWTRLLRENVKPDVMICGHAHELNVYYPENTAWNTNGSFCPVVIGSNVKKSSPTYFAGCGYVFNNDSIEIIFTDSNGKILNKEVLPVAK